MSQERKRAVLIYNPASGRRRAAARAVDFAAAYRRRLGDDLQLRPTTSLSDLRHAAQTTATEYDRQIFMGGDGTISEALQGLSEQSGFQSLRRPVGLLPAGSGNSFLREFAITDYETGREALLEALVAEETVAADIGLIRYTRGSVGSSEEAVQRISFHFWGVGLVCDIAALAMKLRPLGSLNYTVASVIKILTHRPYRLRITVDGQQQVIDCNFLTVSNSRFTGGAMMIAPLAQINDGRLCLVISRIKSRWELFRMMPKIFRGRHLDHPGVDCRFVSEVAIEQDETMTFNVDGELETGRHLSIRVCRDFWKIYMSPDRLRYEVENMAPL